MNPQNLFRIIMLVLVIGGLLSVNSARAQDEVQYGDFFACFAENKGIENCKNLFPHEMGGIAAPGATQLCSITATHFIWRGGVKVIKLVQNGTFVWDLALSKVKVTAYTSWVEDLNKEDAYTATRTVFVRTLNTYADYWFPASTFKLSKNGQAEYCYKEELYVSGNYPETPESQSFRYTPWSGGECGY